MLNWKDRLLLQCAVLLLGVVFPVALHADIAGEQCSEGSVPTRLLSKGTNESSIRETSLCEDRIDFRALFYSPSFAKRFRFPTEGRHLTSALPDWIGAVQLNGYSYGSANVFDLRILVSKKVQLDLPHEQWVGRAGFQARMHFPPSAARPLPYRSDKIFPVHLRSTNFSRDPEALRGFWNSASLIEIDPNYFPEFVYLRIFVGSKRWLEKMLEVAQSSRAQIVLSLPAVGGESWNSPGGEYAFVIPNDVWCSVDEILDIPMKNLEGSCND
ncbi:hypothetical protein [Tepidicaulis marinus]|uniref:hypothetical protein n=1 Tax=Tepidicaulis marinus TaxID=1333998 RepID=UPI0012E02D2A|nr:hypothetical protein [Tepidicaulis marinus]